MEENSNSSKDINWTRFGLGTETAQRQRANTSGFVDLSSNFDYGAGGHQASGANELFAEEQVNNILKSVQKLIIYNTCHHNLIEDVFILSLLVTFE